MLDVHLYRRLQPEGPAPSAAELAKLATLGRLSMPGSFRRFPFRLLDLSWMVLAKKITPHQLLLSRILPQPPIWRARYAALDGVVGQRYRAGIRTDDHTFPLPLHASHVSHSCDSGWNAPQFPLHAGHSGLALGAGTRAWAVSASAWPFPETFPDSQYSASACSTVHCSVLPSPEARALALCNTA
jgi:hypothetical protein